MNLDCFCNVCRLYARCSLFTSVWMELSTSCYHAVKSRILLFSYFRLDAKHFVLCPTFYSFLWNERDAEAQEHLVISIHMLRWLRRWQKSLELVFDEMVLDHFLVSFWRTRIGLWARWNLPREHYNIVYSLYKIKVVQVRNQDSKIRSLERL